MVRFDASCFREGETLSVPFILRDQMAGFPLFALHPTLLEQVFTKLEQISYFRLQQTCHGMHEFVRTNRNVKAFVWMDDSLEWDEEGRPAFDDVKRDLSVDIESLYGVRIKYMTCPAVSEELFEPLCSQLKKYRITCDRLDADFWPPSKEQCSELFKLLKPRKIKLDSKESDRLEALLAWKKAESVFVEVTPNQLLPSMRLLTPHFPKVNIVEEISNTDSPALNIDEYFELLKGVLEYLRAEPLPNLRRFGVGLGDCDELLPSVENQLKRLRDYHPTVMTAELTYAYVVQGELGRSGPFFELTMTRELTRIFYKPEGPK